MEEVQRWLVSRNVPSGAREQFAGIDGADLYMLALPEFIAVAGMLKGTALFRHLHGSGACGGRAEV